MLRLIWSHIRDIHVSIARNYITYTIPLHAEKNLLGSIESININNGDILVVFKRSDPPLQ